MDAIVMDLCDRSMVQFLLDRGADIHAKDGNGETVLFAAGNQAMAQFLLDRGADIHARNIYRETVLFPPVRKGDQAMAQFLLDRGADIHARDGNGETALSSAKGLGKRKIASYLAPRLSQAEVESLEGEDLEILLPHLTSKQKDWVNIEEFKEISPFKKRELLPYLSQRLFQQLAEDLYSVSLDITEVHKSWITLRQFQTLPNYGFQFKEEIALYVAPRLSQTEVESLEGDDLEILLPHLTSEQQEWVDIEKKERL